MFEEDAANANRRGNNRISSEFVGRRGDGEGGALDEARANAAAMAVMGSQPSNKASFLATLKKGDVKAAFAEMFSSSEASESNVKTFTLWTKKEDSENPEYLMGRLALGKRFLHVFADQNPWAVKQFDFGLKPDHASKMGEALELIVTSATKPQVLQHKLRVLSLSHVQMGIKPAMFTDFEKALFSVLKKVRATGQRELDPCWQTNSIGCHLFLPLLPQCPHQRSLSALPLSLSDVSSLRSCRCLSSEPSVNRFACPSHHEIKDRPERLSMRVTRLESLAQAWLADHFVLACVPWALRSVQVLGRYHMWTKETEEGWRWMWDIVRKTFTTHMNSSERVLDIMDRSWDYIEMNCDLQEISDRFFERLFSVAPDLQTFFTKPKKMQFVMFAKAMDLIVRSVSDAKVMEVDLKAIAMRHIKYDIRSEHLEVFGSVLLQTLGEAAGPAHWDEDIEAAWGEIYFQIAGVFRHVVSTGRNLVSKALASGSTDELDLALNVSARNKRVLDALEIDVDDSVVSPIVWTIQEGQLHLTNSLLKDLLAIRADRDNYYYGRAVLWRKHPWIMSLLVEKAPNLLLTFLDGHMWTSQFMVNGYRRVNYYVQELYADPMLPQNENVKDTPLGLLVNQLPDSELSAFAHPTIRFVVDLKWEQYAARDFISGQMVNMLTLALGVTYMTLGKDKPWVSLGLFAFQAAVAAIRVVLMLWRSVTQLSSGKRVNVFGLTVPLPLIMQDGYTFINFTTVVMICVLFVETYAANPFNWKEAIAGDEPHIMTQEEWAAHHDTHDLMVWSTLAAFTTGLLWLQMVEIFKVTTKLSALLFSLTAVVSDVMRFILVLGVWAAGFSMMLFFLMVGSNLRAGADIHSALSVDLQVSHSAWTHTTAPTSGSFQLPVLSLVFQIVLNFQTNPNHCLLGSFRCPAHPFPTLLPASHSNSAVILAPVAPSHFLAGSFTHRFSLSLSLSLSLSHRQYACFLQVDGYSDLGTLLYFVVMSCLGLTGVQAVMEANWLVRVVYAMCVLTTVVVILNLLVSTMVSTYEALNRSFDELAVKTRAELVVRAEAASSMKRRLKYFDACEFGNPLEFEDADDGPSGGIQKLLAVRDMEHRAFRVLDRVERYAGTTNPEAPWSADDKLLNANKMDAVGGGSGGGKGSNMKALDQINREIQRLGTELFTIKSNMKVARDDDASSVGTSDAGDDLDGTQLGGGGSADGHHHGAEGGDHDGHDHHHRHEEEEEARPLEKSEMRIVPFPELEAHSTEASLWLTVDGVVRDVTSLVGFHPGGKAVLLEHACKDASAAFHASHKGPSLTIASAMLKSMPLIGRLESPESAVPLPGTVSSPDSDTRRDSVSDRFGARPRVPPIRGLNTGAEDARSQLRASGSPSDGGSRRRDAPQTARDVDLDFDM